MCICVCVCVCVCVCTYNINKEKKYRKLYTRLLKKGNHRAGWDELFSGERKSEMDAHKQMNKQITTTKRPTILRKEGVHNKNCMCGMNSLI